MKRFKKLITAVVIIISILLTWWFNTFTLKTTRLTIHDGRINNEIRIVHLTDLHGASFGKNNAALISRIDKASPDIVVVTGDMWTRGNDSDNVDVAVRLMKDLCEKYTVYFVDGGHDSAMGEWINNGIINAVYLNYETAEITVGETTIALHGIPNYHFSHDDSAALFALLDADVSKYNVLLAHEPRFQQYIDFGADLSLVGHTHGGMVRLPFVGAAYSRSHTNHNVWFPELRNIAHLYGLLESNGAKIYISGGLGVYPVPVRFFNRPEIVLVRLLPD